ncbi:hypothetical protein HER32_01085 [Hymenobacter sp. BT18]|uniref:hypothetical protein n=1 Tax=Hymenobacter sp. BT18 TaxID=2835648 RepID=UPI00143EE8DA|nr:hypothetical protein [Hymenobacter sp. BT18]QIX59857.1 hypothetical protein HER32_01085 [Hymenobacter sp. BT18]
MKAPNLGIDPDDLSEVIIPQIEKSFGITFQQKDVADVYTFGQLCAVVRSKLPAQTANDCTTQQAFYKLRQALELHTPTESIHPGALLVDILPVGRQRRRTVAAIERELGMKLNLLGMPPLILGVGCSLLIISLGSLFFDLTFGLIGIACSIAGLRLADKLGTYLTINTLRDVAERMSSRHYRASRRHPEQVNPREITARMQYLFLKDYGIDLIELTPEATL